MTATGPDPELAARVARSLGDIADPCLAAAGIRGSIIDLGLIQDVRADDAGEVEVAISLTEMGCAFTHHLLDRVTRTVEGVDGVRRAAVRPVWTWEPGQMRDRLREDLRARADALPGLLGSDHGRRVLPVVSRTPV